MKRVTCSDGSVQSRLLSIRLLWQCMLLLAMSAVFLVGGCKRDADGQLPQVGGEKIAAKREAVKGFGLVAAYPDQKDDDELAIALEFAGEGQLGAGRRRRR